MGRFLKIAGKIIQEYIDDKSSILDIKAETNNKELIDIEMQLNWYKEMPERLLYYHGGLLRESLHEGEYYDKMKKTITICITDSVAFLTTGSLRNFLHWKFAWNISDVQMKTEANMWMNLFAGEERI